MTRRRVAFAFSIVPLSPAKPDRLSDAKQLAVANCKAQDIVALQIAQLSSPHAVGNRSALKCFRYRDISRTRDGEVDEIEAGSRIRIHRP